jgi:hypothetical protein
MVIHDWMKAKNKIAREEKLIPLERHEQHTTA